MKLPIHPVLLSMFLFVCILNFSCKPDDPNGKKLDISKWSHSMHRGGDVFYTDSSWVFVKITEDFLNDTQDTVLLGPYRGHPPVTTQFEYFDEDIIETEDDSWVLESLSPEGCVIRIFAYRNGQITLLNTYLMKGCNCEYTSFDTDLQRKTLIGETYDEDSLRIFVINYKTGALIDSISTTNGDYEDIELLEGKVVKVEERDSVYIDVITETDVQDRYIFPGKFVKARENGKGCKIMILRNNNNYVSYILCPDSPLSHISTPNIQYGDSLIDIQAHSISDTARFVIASYDTLIKRTRIDLLDTLAARRITHSVNGVLLETKRFCNNRIKAFVSEDTLAQNGEGTVYLDGFHLTMDRIQEFNPKEVNGRLLSVTPLENPCGLSLSVRDVNGQTQTYTIQLKD